MRSVSGIGRVAALAAVIAAAVLVAVLLFGGGGSDYTVKATFLNASQLVNGNSVQVGGVRVGSVDGIKITDDGQAEITLKVAEDYAPLPAGTRAVDPPGVAVGHREPLRRPADPGPRAAGRRRRGGRGGDRATRARSTTAARSPSTRPRPRSTSTSSSTPSTRTRAAASRSSSRAAPRCTRAARARRTRGYRYLNPSLSRTARLFRELNHDTPALERFIVDSSQLVTALAERRDHLAALIGNLNDTTRAIGNEKVALASAIEQLPDFMRRSNSTFVNLRAALDDVEPLVDASKPVAKKLQPFLNELRPFASDARPTIRDLSAVVRRERRGQRPDRADEDVHAARGHRRRRGHAQRRAAPRLDRRERDRDARHGADHRASAARTRPTCSAGSTTSRRPAPPTPRPASRARRPTSTCSPRRARRR